MSDFVPVYPGNLPDVSQSTLHELLGSGGISPGMLRRVCDYIETHLEGNIGLQELAGIAGLSTSHFGRAFKQSKGVTPHRYLTQRRVQRALELLAGTELAFSEIALAAGFADQSHFCRQFRSVVGTTPSTYRGSKR